MTPERWKQIEQIYHQAQQRDAKARPAFLDQACGTDDELRRQVESLLRADDDAQSFLDAPAMNLAAQMVAEEQRPLVGKQISHYKIVERIGAGGMGEVYRARDERLGRDVAIKVLPAHFAQDENLRRRFEREARAISSLSHAHICSIYDIGHQDGINYLVLEYVEGDTLTSRIAKGAMPIDRVLRYSIEIAQALDHAHRHAIVHRDLKPGNIILTKSGAKLLDFGLAKFQSYRAQGNVLLSSDPTASTELTSRGTIIGTLQYMSPEQAEGKDSDARTDIFALGAVIYEMATGKKAFEAPSQAGLIAAILHTEPKPISELHPDVPATLDRVVKTCLTKDPDDRWQTAHDLMLQLKWIADGASESRERASVTDKGRGRERLWWVAAIFVTALLASVAAWLFARSPVPTSRPLARFTLELPVNTRLVKDERPLIALSPDGTTLVYVLTNGANTQLYVRRMDQLNSEPIPGTEGATGPFFSPDGQWVGFFANNRLKKVSLKGGAPLNLCNASPVTRGAVWCPDDTILFVQAHSEGVSRVSASGATPQVITAPDAQNGEIGHYWPEILPGGKHVLFTVARAGSFDEAHIVVQSLETGVRQTLLKGGANAHYVPTGHLVYVRAGSVMAAPFDLEQLKVMDTAVPVVEGLMVDPSTGAGHFSFSGAGSLVYVTGGAEPTGRSLVWVDRRGATRTLTDGRRQFQNPILSPDGRRLAVGIYGTSQDIWIYDFARGTLTPLTFYASEDWGPIWTHDGQRVTFTSVKPGAKPNLSWKAADGSDTEEPLTISNDPQFTGSWSPDGKTLAFTAFDESNDPSTGNDIWVLTLEGDRQPRPFLRTTFSEYGPEFSPDGHWLAYVSNESGRNEVYVQPFPGPGAKRQISTEGGFSPVWAGNGRELFYRHDDKMMSVAITLQPGFTAAVPRLLFAGKYEETGRPDDPRNYDVTYDGQRFVMIKASEQPSTPSQLIVALEWFDELRRRVPVKLN
jgi:serine/threonine protein kinase/Tol biopolymer transport system component